MYHANDKWQATTLPATVYKLFFNTRATPGIHLVFNNVRALSICPSVQSHAKNVRKNDYTDQKSNSDI